MKFYRIFYYNDFIVFTFFILFSAPLWNAYLQMQAIHHFDLSEGITQEELDRKYDIQEKDPEGREQVDFE